MAETARAVVKDFLQSVVVVDDRATLGGEGVAMPAPAELALHGDAEPEWAEETASTGPARARARRRLANLRVPSYEAMPAPEQALDAKVLVDGFAEQGLVCAVIRPAPGESPVDRTVRAARRADIVILDWELNGDDGTSTLEIVRRLVHEEAEAEPRGRLRLIAVYSGALTLRQIASRLRQALAQEPGTVRFKKDGEFAITAGSVRVTVFAKPTTRAPICPIASSPNSQA
jgi:hypothetical protein